MTDAANGVDARSARNDGGRGRSRRAQAGRVRARRVIFGVALAWSLLQLWYASPLPFTFNVFILNDGRDARRCICASHSCSPSRPSRALKSSPRERIPAAGLDSAPRSAFCGAYLFIFYRELATRPGQPTPLDFVVSVIGMLLLLEATRRVVGPPLADHRQR